MLLVLYAVCIPILVKFVCLEVGFGEAFMLYFCEKSTKISLKYGKDQRPHSKYNLAFLTTTYNVTSTKCRLYTNFGEVCMMGSWIWRSVYVVFLSKIY